MLNVIKKVSVLFLLVVVVVCQVGSSIKSLQDIFLGISFLGNPFVFSFIAICAGLGLCLVYLPDVVKWAKQYFTNNKQTVKLQDNNVKTIKENLNSSKHRVELLRLVDENEKNFYWYIKNVFKFIASINYIICNPILAMVGGCLLAVYVSQIFYAGAAIAASLQIFVAVSSYLSGAFLAAVATYSIIMQMVDKALYWVRFGKPIDWYSISPKLMITGFVVLAAAGNSYWSGANLLINLALLCQGSWLGTFLLNASPVVALFIGVLCCSLTILSSSSLYFGAVDKRVDNFLAINKNYNSIVYDNIFLLNYIIVAASCFMALVLNYNVPFVFSTIALAATWLQANVKLHFGFLLVIAVVHMVALNIFLFSAFSVLFNFSFNLSCMLSICLSLMVSKEFLFSNSPFEYFSENPLSLSFSFVSAFGLAAVYSTRLSSILIGIMPVQGAFLVSAFASGWIFLNFFLNIFDKLDFFTTEFSSVVSAFSLSENNATVSGDKIEIELQKEINALAQKTFS